MKIPNYIQRMARWVAYLGVAAGLGVLWYCALMVPRLTRTILLHDSRRSLVLLLVISLVLALLSKRFVLGPLDPERTCLIAIITPLFGSVLFIWSMTLLGSIGDSTALTASVPGSVVMLLFLGVSGVVTVSISAFYVVIPMGALSLYLMRRVGKAMWSDSLRLAIQHV